MPADDFVVTPWNVEGDIDYDKLIKRFGTQKITPELLSKIEKFTKLLDRGILVSTNLTFINIKKHKKILSLLNKKIGANDEKHKKTKPKRGFKDH